MGFSWKGLGKGLLTGGAAIAAPFTGGASLATVLPAVLAGGGALASAIGSGRAQGRIAESGINSQHDALKLRAAQMLEDALQSRAGLDLQRRQFQLQAPGMRASNAKRGDVLANAQDASISGPIIGTRGQVPQISGGLRPSLFSENTRQLGQGMSRDALLQQMAGDKFDALPAPNIPSITAPPQSGKFDTFLNTLGGIGGVAEGLFGDDSLLKKFGKPQPPQIPQIPLNPLILPGGSGGPF